MKRLPTDRQILNAIYERYYQTFSQYTAGGDNSRSTKVYVPIDIRKIAEDLKVDSDIIFGRLYYHLERKHAYTQDDNSKVHLFTLCIGEDVHCVNFPLVASALAELRDHAKKYSTATCIAIGSLIVAITSIVISIFGQQ